MGKIFSYIGQISEMDFQKDVILTPSYLAKWRNTNCDLYYGQSTSKTNLPQCFRNVTLHCINREPGSKSFFLQMQSIIVKNSSQIDVLVTFHFSWMIIFLTFVLKALNPKAKVWVLGDLNLDIAERLRDNEFVFSEGISRPFKKRIINTFFKRLDIFSLETSKYISMFRPVFERKGWKCLTYFPCGWDEDNPYSSKECKKENVILSCARFGTYQKNTEMLLEGLAKVDLKEWKVYLVGPVTSDFSLNENKNFELYIDEYYQRFPQLRECVIFTGPIFDTKLLFSYFQKAKIFVMTSRYEGFANVFSQARWNQCFIVSTDVGGAQDMSENWKYGRAVRQDDSKSLSENLQFIINEGCSKMPREFSNKISYNELIPAYICPKL